MTIALNNLNKPTPRIPRLIGNLMVMIALGLQPIVTGASPDILTQKAQFWISFGLAAVGIGGKFFTMLFKKDDELQDIDY